MSFSKIKLMLSLSLNFRSNLLLNFSTEKALKFVCLDPKDNWPARLESRVFCTREFVVLTLPE